MVRRLANPDQLRVLADLTLALVLFIDAANADLSVLRKQFKIPSRMLLIGLPGVILLGFGFAINVLEAALPGSYLLGIVVVTTVLMSLIAHGVTAKPLAAWIGRQEGIESQDHT